MIDRTPPASLLSHDLDHSQPIQAPDGTLNLSGWLFTPSRSRVKVRLKLSEHSIFDCVTGIVRPDVAQQLPAAPENSGFSLTAILPAGLHIGSLEFQMPDQGDWSCFRQLTISVGVSPLFAALESAPPRTSTTWFAHGWCFHPQAHITSMSLEFSGYQVELTHSGERPDVAEAYPQFGPAARSGFGGHFRIGPGSGNIYLTAQLETGSVVRTPLVVDHDIDNAELKAARQAVTDFRARRIALPDPQSPTVSVVIPIYNQLDLTLACLESLALHSASIPFECIIIDDNSAEEVRTSLSLVNNLRLYSNETNQGFVRNCNRAATEARGEYIVFLNNDTEVSAGWLEALLEVFALRPDAGLAGAKLVFPDGRLQEAGGLIWSDGRGWNLGRGESPDRPEFNYLRRADYCSGAALMVRRTLFHQLGGFDELYCPAYYEDVDLAFKVRAHGLHVYYQPKSVVLHREGMSSGTSTASGVKRHQVINQEKFRKKWNHVLQDHGSGPHFVELARDRFYGRRVLVVDACALTPDMDAGSVRMFNMLRILSDEGMKVTFAAENLQSYEPFSSQLRSFGIEHLTVPYCSNLLGFLEDFAFAFDVFIISRKGVCAKFVPVIRRTNPSAKIIFDTVDLMFLRLNRQAEITRSPELSNQASQSRDEELGLAEATDMTYVVSEDEAAVLAADIPPEKLAVVPLINPTHPPKQSFSEREGILFVGGFQHPPNLDGVLFFLDEVLPLIRKTLPDINVHIVGSRTPAELLARQDKHTIVHGFLPDLAPLLEHVRLSIAPLRFGAGVKGKINQSMACGLPVVGTTIAVEGMHLTAEENCLVADTAQSFAEAVCRLHREESLWNKLSTAGLHHVEKYFSFARVREQILESFGRLNDRSKHRRGLQLPARPLKELAEGEWIACGSEGGSASFLGTGWDGAYESHRWSVATKAVIRFTLSGDALRYRFSADFFPLLVPDRVPLQTVELRVLGVTDSTSWIINEGGLTSRDFLFELPANGDRIVEMEWTFPNACKPSTLGISADERQLAVALVRFGISSLQS